MKHIILSFIITLLFSALVVIVLSTKISTTNDMLLNQKKQILSLDTRLKKLEHLLQHNKNIIQKETGLLANNTQTYNTIVLKKWQIHTEYSKIYGAFSLNNNLLFIFPDGSFIITKEKTIIKNGKINSSISSMNTLDNNIFYFISNSGSLIAYDFEEYKKLWEIKIGLPSNIKLITNSKYILFTTPTNLVKIIDKKTGVIIAENNFSHAICQPSLTKKGLLVCSVDKIELFQCNEKFSPIKEMHSNLKQIEFVKYFKSDVQILSNKKIYSFDINTFKLTEISGYKNFNIIQNDIVYSKDKYNFIVRNRTKIILPKSLQQYLYYNDRVKIFSKNNSVIMQNNNVNKIIPLNIDDIYKVSVVDNNVIFLTNKKGIYGYSYVKN